MKSRYNINAPLTDKRAATAAIALRGDGDLTQALRVVRGEADEQQHAKVVDDRAERRVVPEDADEGRETIPINAMNSRLPRRVRSVLVTCP